MYSFEEPQLPQIQLAVAHGDEESQGDDVVQHDHQHRDDSNPQSEVLQMNKFSDTSFINANEEVQ